MKKLFLKSTSFFCFIFLSLMLFYQQDAFSSSTKVVLVSWNIQLLPNGPSIFSKSLQKSQKVRLPWIIEHCNNSDYDIIVFQEVFDIELKRKLKRELIKIYPYQVNTKTKFGRLTSNGVLIVSKVPIKYIDHVIYKKGVTEDGLASKGCTLVEAEKDGIIFQIAGTHLQSGNSKEAIKHRHSQYEAIKNLIFKYKNDTIPVFVIGDLNTRKCNHVSYNKMLKTIGVSDFPLNDIEPYTIDKKNSWNNQNNSIQLDYILLNRRNTSTKILKQNILRLSRQYKNKRMDFSDHYGITCFIEVNN